jgi:aryl-alcohol dehydrogenase-like predicted oxidoreductase
MIGRAISSGVNFIDIANVYGGGETEKIVGTVMRELRCRECMVLATVGSPTSRAAHRASVL